MSTSSGIPTLGRHPGTRRSWSSFLGASPVACVRRCDASTRPSFGSRCSCRFSLSHTTHLPLPAVHKFFRGIQVFSSTPRLTQPASIFRHDLSGTTTLSSFQISRINQFLSLRPPFSNPAHFFLGSPCPQKMTMERTLPADWRRDDAPGAELPFSTLEQRCAARNLSVLGGRSEMIERLDHHQKVCSEKRLTFWQNQPSDDPSYEDAYKRALQLADCTKLRIVQAKNVTWSGHFQVTHEGDQLAVVRFGREVWCTCKEWRRYTCVHIVC